MTVPHGLQQRHLEAVQDLFHVGDGLVRKIEGLEFLDLLRELLEQRHELLILTQELVNRDVLSKSLPPALVDVQNPADGVPELLELAQIGDTLLQTLVLGLLELEEVLRDVKL